jgi:glycosylphosphatidylinositol transamidase (GPIT) subunit GPI8
MLKLIALLFVVSSVACDDAAGVNWAVLVAGSNEYYNYR